MGEAIKISTTDVDNFKSAFARSVVINSKRKSDDFNNTATMAAVAIVNSALLNNAGDNNGLETSAEEKVSERLFANEIEVIRLRKECQSLVEENRRLNSDSGNGSSSNKSNKNSITNTNKSNELPVENFVLQSQVDTLEWQLKQTESSRLMYRELLEQMVCFLDRAHRSLDIMSERIQTPSGSTLRRQACVPRSLSVHHVSSPPPPVLRAHSTAQIQHDTSDSSSYAAFKDFTWRKPKRNDPVSSDEISPERLSKDALRLLRTAQSLLNTSEPDLVHNTKPKEDIEQADKDFLRQLAREFPPQETLKQVEVSQISTAFNRKLSRTPSIIETDFPVLAPGLLTTGLESSFSGTSNSPTTEYPFDKEKSRSPPIGGGSISSAEDESGFSSMSSFQEIGLPIINSTIIENCEKGEKDTEKLFWLHQNMGKPTVLSAVATTTHPIHRRWSSNPVDTAKRDPLRVLWV